MCGIFGVSHLNKGSLQNAHNALNRLAHRGPNSWHYIYENSVYLGHRRLSILDLSENGRQPMQANNVSIIANGEIYNYKQLKLILTEEFGCVFKSESDSEVILHGYIKWGLQGLLKRLDGMFAFAIYDSAENKIHIARDHAGIKPLYYSLKDDTLAFASELKSLEELYKDDLKVDHTAVYDFLTYKYIPSPKSLYENVFKLEPACYGTFNLKTKSFSKACYWKVRPHRTIKDEAEAINLVQSSFEKEIKKHLISDVPVGSFLSGGVDSSIVSYECSKLVDVLNTCSISFEDKNVDESIFAQKVAEKIHSNHISECLTNEELNNLFPQIKCWFDEPFGDTSAYPTFAVSRLAKKKMTVVLTGDGGDELFAGYNHYKNWYQKLTYKVGFLFPIRPIIKALVYADIPKISKIARKIEIFTILNPLERKVRLNGGLLKSHPFKRSYAKKFKIPKNYDDLWHYKQYDNKKLKPLSRAMYLDFYTTMTDSYLCKVDRTSMANAIETRVPFLSKQVIQVAWSLDESLLIKNGELKYILKKAYENVLPHECLYRRKQGFSIGAAAQDYFKDTKNLVSIPLLTKLYPEVLK